jgi:hypothetical protein
VHVSVVQNHHGPALPVGVHVQPLQHVHHPQPQPPRSTRNRPTSRTSSGLICRASEV